MNHYKEKTRSVQLTHTKTPPHKHHYQCKNQDKNQERTTRKTGKKRTAPQKTATPSLRSSASAPLKKRPARQKKTISPPTAKLNRQNAPHAQNPLFQRLRAAPARAKPPVNFVLDRQGGRKSVKRKKNRHL